MNPGPRVAVDAALATPERAGRTTTKPVRGDQLAWLPGYVADRYRHQWDIANYLFVPQMLLPHD